MAEVFNPNKNPLLYILSRYVYVYNRNIKKKEVQSQLYSEFSNYILYMLNNSEDLKYFDYILKFDRFVDKVEIKAQNIVTALWFINIFPTDSYKVLVDGKYHIKGGSYKFNKKTKKLKWTKSK